MSVATRRHIEQPDFRRQSAGAEDRRQKAQQSKSNQPDFRRYMAEKADRLVECNREKAD